MRPCVPASRGFGGPVVVWKTTERIPEFKAPGLWPQERQRIVDYSTPEIEGAPLLKLL